MLVAFVHSHRTRFLLNLPRIAAIVPLQPTSIGLLRKGVGTDIVVPLPPTKKENRYTPVAADWFTKVAEAEPMETQGADTVASIFLNQ